ncbi:hypothetical protein Tco_0183200 [Tanacetum coccineum]
MSVQSSSSQIELHFPNPKKSLQFRQVEESKFDNLFHDSIQGEDENTEDVQMADHLRPMEELLRIPILGIKDAIVIPTVLADQFELKPELLDFVSNNSFFGLENDDPHSHIRKFYQIAQTLRLNQVLNDVAKNKSQVLSSGGTSTQIDAITALTKQVEAIEYHFASMRETYDQNQEAAVQLMQNQIGQMADFQERPLGEFPRNIGTNPPAELTMITSTDGLTLDGSFLSHYNFLEKDQEPKTITEVVEIASSKSTPLVPPPETPPFSAPKPKKESKPNPYQPPIPYPCRLHEENFQALENLTGRADHFVYRIDIVD